MSTQARALRRIADQLKDLPKIFPADILPEPSQAMLEQCREAGRLVMAAMDNGFHSHLESLAELRAAVAGHDANAALWILIHQNWLQSFTTVARRHLGNRLTPWHYTFTDDCRAMADLIDADADRIDGESTEALTAITPTEWASIAGVNKSTASRRAKGGPLTRQSAEAYRDAHKRGRTKAESESESVAEVEEKMRLAEKTSVASKRNSK